MHEPQLCTLPWTFKQAGPLQWEFTLSHMTNLWRNQSNSGEDITDTKLIYMKLWTDNQYSEKLILKFCILHMTKIDFEWIISVKSYVLQILSYQ
jgi:hypothetical protein